MCGASTEPGRVQAARCGFSGKATTVVRQDQGVAGRRTWRTGSAIDARIVAIAINASAAVIAKAAASNGASGDGIGSTLASLGAW
jgi:hypothetical protein